jgi:PQQ-dependent catabolism-associated CXXCW motif protein
VTRGNGVRLAVILMSSVLLVAGSASAQDRPVAPREQRVALVIGNSSYVVGPLKNPVNDAEDMAKLLPTLGFRVTLLRNATHQQMVEAINAFGHELKNGGVGLFYYAGHGVQSRGRNYLIPVNARIEAESQLEFDTVDANRVLAAMDDAGNRVNLVILDACRDNPFARSFRSAAQGLAQMEAAQGTYIAFATGPGSVAADGGGRNGLYTQYLLQSLRQPNTDIDKVFRRVTAEVARATSGKQVPWVSSSLTGDFSFRPDASAPKAGSPAHDRAFWDSVKDSRSADELNAYLEQFPNGMFATLARARLKSMAAAKPTTQVAAVPPSAQPAPAQPAPSQPVPSQSASAQPALAQPVTARSDTQARLAVATLPFLNDGGKARIEREFVGTGKTQKVLAMTEAGGWGMAQGRPTVEDARAGALTECQKKNSRHPCFVAAVNDDAVLQANYTPQSVYDGAMELLKRAPLESEFYFNENRDAGLPPTRARHTGTMHEATPRTVPGAKTITTRELVELYKTSKPVLINVLDWTEGAFALPGSLWIQGMGKGRLSGSDFLELKSLFAQAVPDKNTPLVIYCLSWECWLSYNATLTASDLGYKNLYWYRGGVSAWNQARLPVVRTKLFKQL